MVKACKLLAICMLCLMMLFLMKCSLIFKPDPDIIVYCEIDYVSKCAPITDLIGNLMSEYTKNEGENHNRRGLECKLSECGLEVPDDITISEMYQICQGHANLSNYESWWLYLAGIKRLNSSYDYAGYCWLVGSPDDAADNSYSVVCIKTIEYYANPHKKVEELTNTVTAHELFHQFHCSDHWGGYNLCVMYLPFKKQNPAVDLCPDCALTYRSSKP